MWIIFAILSSVFAAATAILAKIGIDGVNSKLAFSDTLRTRNRYVMVVLL